ncbi:MAG: hypothetical protein WCF85_16270 [Rhodospirillaceae bacterium]
MTVINNLPAPLVPPDCDITDFKFMPVDISRLFDSDFNAQSTDSEWRAGVTLWLKSFHQVPAASLPDNDTILARLAEFGRDIDGWISVKAGALYGWVKCSDGRFYHPVVAEKAIEAWRRKQKQREKGKAGNAKRWGARLDHGNEPADGQGCQSHDDRTGIAGGSPDDRTTIARDRDSRQRQGKNLNRKCNLSIGERRNAPNWGESEPDYSFDDTTGEVK